MNTTQVKFVIKELKKKGKISRNHCLNNGITRLGAVIKILEDEKFVFDTRPSSTGKTMLNGFWEKNKLGTWDYVYYLLSMPKQ